jgi:hypothetical protein
MDPTTLVTFIFKAPPNTRTVELLGSWDNFRQPYTMRNDRRRGHGIWSGCFRFYDIIFDGEGEQLSFNQKPRTGGLKQGGTYWYYYRLDYDVEAYDDSKDYTTGCPLLPGQLVNVIEVPVEIVPPPSRCRSACIEAENVEGTLRSLKSMPRYALVQAPPRQTMDPNDKFARLEPPPVSKVHGRCVSDLALSGRLEGKPPSVIETPLSLPDQYDNSNTYWALPEGADLQARRRPSSEDRSSSRRSWESVLESDFHSSIFDAHPVDAEHEEHPDPLRCFPVPGSDGNDFINPDLEAFGMGLQPTVSGDDEQQTNQDQREDSSGYGPRSISNVQMYGSRPPTANNNAGQWRPRVYSFSDNRVLALSSHPPGKPATSPPTYITAQSEAASSQDSPTEDIWSPTFSAATISSNGGGINTPFRLSVGYSRGSGAPHKQSYDGQRALDDVTQRLASLNHRASTTTDESPNLPTLQELDDERTPTFTAYSLPAPADEEVVGRKLSLGRVASLEDSVPRSMNLSLPSIMLPEVSISTGSTMADDIFSELGYLGGSIV